MHDLAKNRIKKILLQDCLNWVENRQIIILGEKKRIEDSLVNETKSSAGDKHETGRAMLQIERENMGKQLYEIQKTLEIIHRTDISGTSEKVKLGSLVITNRFSYFICVSAGAFSINKKEYYAVSINSPVGQLLMGKSMGHVFQFNNTETTIENIC